MPHTMLVLLALGTVPPPIPCGEIPNPRQLDRLRLEVCALVHLGVPTFLDRDVARPTDDPSIFRLADVPADAWIDDLRTMDLDGLILVVRDDDGFRLAATDVPTAAREAARAASVPFGISVGGKGGAGSLVTEIAELCARLGPLFEVRIGSDVSGSRADVGGVACPDACVVSADGPDFVKAAIGARVGLSDGPWQGVERAISIRPSWYWRYGENDLLRGVHELEEAWFSSAGVGDPLVVGIPADRTGRFQPGDVRRMVEFRRRILATFDLDLAREAIATASATRGGDPTYEVRHAIDGNDSTFWATDDETADATIELAWPSPRTMNIVEMREPPTLGRRTRDWAIEVRIDGEWHEVARGESIGFRRIARFPAIQADALRLRLGSNGCGPALSRLAVFAAPPEVRLVSGEVSFVGRTEALLAADRPDSSIRFTLDGRDPAEHGAAVEGPIPIDGSCLLRAVAIDGRNRAGHPLAVRFARTDDPLFQEAVAGPDAPNPGLHLEIHDGVRESLGELGGRTPRSIATIDDIRLPTERPKDDFALVYRGFIRVPEDGLYTFALKSDDGSRLYLGERLVVERDGVQTWEVREGRVALKRGLHPIRVEFCEFAGRESLTLSWARAGAPLERIPAAAFVR